MRNLYFFWGALLLVDGVFGVEKVNVTVSVMEGDSVTLKPHTVLPEGDSAEWWFGELIAKTNKADFHDGRFRGRLKLDHQNGSLTITNITNTDSGLYTLKIMSSTVIPEIFNVTVSDVVVSVSVVEGDTVTLHTGVTDIQRDDLIQWKFGDQDLKRADARWSNTGDLTIRKIRRDQSGDLYKVEINTSSMILHRKFRINTLGKMKPISVKEGESVILHTGLIEIKGHNLIMWKFKEQLIAEINKGTNQFLTHDTSDQTFNGRLQMHHQSGSLIISNSRITDSGDYHLHMSNSTYIVQMIINVTVSDSRSSGAVSRISGASVGLMLWAVTVFLLHEV